MANKAFTVKHGLNPITDGSVDLGTSSLEFKDLYIDGTAFLDAIGFGTTSVALPSGAGSDGQVLKSNGSNALSWTDTIEADSVGIAQLAGIARGGLIVGDSSGNPALLAAGSDGHVLQINGSGDAVWGANAGAGAQDMYVDGGAWAVKVSSSTTWSFGWWQALDGSWWLLGNTEAADATFTRAQAEFYIPIGDINDVPAS
jgi:hypothetical protein